MYAKTTILFTTTVLSLVFYGLSTSPVLANSSQKSLQGIPSNYANTEVGSPETETLIALNEGTHISQTPSQTQSETPSQAQNQAQNQSPSVTSASVKQNFSGIITSSNGTSMEVKLGDGSFRNFEFNPNLLNSPNIAKGAFVKLSVDENQIVQEVQVAEVEKTLEGTVRDVVGSQVMMELDDGTMETTTVAPAVSARMGIAKGVRLMVTSFQGIGATKLCFGKATPPPVTVSITPPVVVPEPPTRIGGGEPEPIKPPKFRKPVPALW